MLIFGNQQNHLILRLLAACELLENAAFYSSVASISRASHVEEVFGVDANGLPTTMLSGKAIYNRSHWTEKYNRWF